MPTRELFPDRPEPLAGSRSLPNGTRFTWGPIDEIHKVAEYWLVEYRRDASDGGPSMWKDHGKTYFAAYVAGTDTQRRFHTLDSALIGAIVYKREGENSDAAYYIDRMTGVTWPAD